MGQNERAAENRKESRRERAREQRGRRATAVAGIDLRVASWVGIAALNIAFAEAGGALRIGYTRDGGALAIGCYLGDDYATEYIRPSEDMDAALLEIAEAWLPNKGEAFHQIYNQFMSKNERRN